MKGMCARVRNEGERVLLTTQPLHEFVLHAAKMLFDEVDSWRGTKGPQLPVCVNVCYNVAIRLKGARH